MSNGAYENTRKQWESVVLSDRTLEFDAIGIAVASPEETLEWSHGEVTKPETINYRTQRPERDGLFDERIFGPTKDWECYCGKYKKIRYKGIVCDKCGVEVTRSSVRRERLGHIGLAVPVAHIWYLRGVPSPLGLLLDMTVADLEKVIYFASFIILDVKDELRVQALEDLEVEYKEAKESGEDEAEITKLYRETKSEIENLRPRMIVSEAKAQDLSLKYGQLVRVGIGAEAIHELLKVMDLEAEMLDAQAALDRAGANRRRVARRLKLLRDLHRAHLRPEWFIMSTLPVIPPDLRPMVQLDGGRFAASDLNDLYRRVINRNNRLKRLIAQGAPEVINRNEKRMLQEAIDALIDNSARRGRAVVTGTQRRLRSLSDMLRGKQGRFRQNLLGKRVDYSGRSVIVVGPELKLDQCGLPKVMALELFKPFVISRLIRDEFAHNIKSAQRMIDRREAQVWDVLESITKESFVLLNRAPTLHRLGIQAFRPVLIEGKAIQVHPLVCQAFNADFDGDQMAVHVPLSKQAVDEAREIMWSKINLLKPSSGEPIVAPRLDIVLGCYYLTNLQDDAKGVGKIFVSKNEAIRAYSMGHVALRAPIKVRMKKAKVSGKGDTEREGYELVETSVGRILLNNLLPDTIPYVNEVLDSRELRKLTSRVFKFHGIEATAALVDQLMTLGFEYAGISGITFSMADVHIPTEKPAYIEEGNQRLEQIQELYNQGMLTDKERYEKVIEMWAEIKKKVESAMLKQFPKDSPVFMMMDSGARGSIAQVTQMAGMKGLVVNPSGQIIEIPIKGNFKEGLSALEYFISSHGARKGRSDTALRTSDAGYLSRRLVDTAQDVIIAFEDCGTDGGMVITQTQSHLMDTPFADRIAGRIAFDPIILPKKRKPIVAKNEEISDEAAEEISAAGIEEVKVRSVLHCTASWGICQRCYGRDLATQHEVKLGEAVGIMAAQAIGEPGTQLTLKTFHMGGVAREDITSGLPRVEELLEARIPKRPAVLADFEGRAEVQEGKEINIVRVVSLKKEVAEFVIPPDYELAIANGDTVTIKQPIATAQGKKSIRATVSGLATSKQGKVTITSTRPVTKEYSVPSYVSLLVRDGQDVRAGQEISEGHWDLSQALILRGRPDVERYIIEGVQDIYSSQGQTINDKHIEIIIRQMFSKVRITDEGDSDLLPGLIVERTMVVQTNHALLKEKRTPVQFEEIILGLTRTSLKTESFLSAASFQETTSVLIDASVRGAVDRLRGLKENVIIGKLIPAGTGFRLPTDLQSV